MDGIRLDEFHQNPTCRLRVNEKDAAFRSYAGLLVKEGKASCY
jgi:hypothetical protein